MTTPTCDSEDCSFNDYRDYCRRQSGPCACSCHKQIEVTVHGRIGSGPVDVRTMEAFCNMVRAVHQMIEDGDFGERRRTPAPTSRAEGGGV